MYDPPSDYPGADDHSEPVDLPMVGKPEGGQWHNLDGLDLVNGR